jgi:large subunit ribosomal protein L30
LRITLVKSPTGYNENQKRTVRALGLRRLRQTVEHAESPVVRGMIAKIPHLVSVEPALSRTPDPERSEGEGEEEGRPKGK